MNVKFGRAKAKYIGDGVTTNFAVPFGYLRQNGDVFVRYVLSDGTAPLAYFNWINTSTIQLVTSGGVTPYAPPVGAEIWIERFSSLSGPRVDFTDGSTITEAQLDLAYLQALYVAEEALDEAGTLSLAVPDLTRSLASVTASASAASASATAAAGSATSAATSATNAANSATNAANSATNAAISAANASNAVGTFGLLKANNLSDLANAATARANLGLGSMAVESAATYLTSAAIAAAYLSMAGNLAGLANAGTARTNLGLGTGDTVAFSVARVGDGAVGAPSLAFVNETDSGFYRVGAGNLGWAVSGARQWVMTAGIFGLEANTNFGWYSSGFGAQDLKLARDAAGVLAQRNGTNAQGFRVYNTFTDASNYERAMMAWSSNVLEIGTENLGTGSGRELRLNTRGSGSFISFYTGNSARWNVNSSGMFMPATHNTYDLGSNAVRVKDGYFQGNLTVGGTITGAISGGGVGRNLLRNGAMKVAQRGSSYALTTTAAYGSVDGWTFKQASAANGFASQNDWNKTGFSKCIRIGRNTGATGTGSIQMMQILPTIDSRDLEGKTATLSFHAFKGADFSAASGLLFVKVFTGTGTDQTTAAFDAGTQSGAATPLSTTVGAITTSDALYQASVAIPSGVKQIAVQISYTPVGTAGADDSVYITGVKLEEGSAATAYENIPAGLEWARARFWYRRWWADGSNDAYISTGACYTTSNALVPLVDDMRSVPAVGYSALGDLAIHDGVSATALTSFTVAGTQSGINGFLAVSGTPLTAGRPAVLKVSLGAGKYLELSCDL